MLVIYLIMYTVHNSSDISVNITVCYEKVSARSGWLCDMQVVFGAVLVVYVVLVMLTVSAVREVPLQQLPDLAVDDANCKFTHDHGHDSE